MIRLTRIQNQSHLYLNPDHIERLDSHHETTVKMFNGTEYVVTESAAEIIRLVIELRAQVLALASRLERQVVVSHDPHRPLEIDRAANGGN